MFSRDFTASLCVHATGTTISFTSKTSAALGPIHVTGSTTSFQINTSGWPSGLPTAAITLSSSNLSVTTNTTVTFTATVTSGATGSVTFYDGDIAIGMSVVSGTTATLSTGELAIGIHAITALYSGDSNFSSDVSSPITETVSLASEACTISAMDLRAYPRFDTGSEGRWRMDLSFHTGSAATSSRLKEPTRNFIEKSNDARRQLRAGTYPFIRSCNTDIGKKVL